jgi:membrane associated rhomboid family serine protease
MLLLLPYKVDAIEDRWPWANYLLLACLATVHAVLVLRDEGLPEALVLQGWSAGGLLGSMFLHVGWGHLIGNLVFLWVFGNAVAARLGNLAFLALFLGTGVAAGATHVLLSDAPVVGASGAINGVVGAYLVLFPRTRVSLLWVVLYRGGTFLVQSAWLLGLWFGLDLLGALADAPGIAYLSHVGGFAAGFLACAGLVLAGRVRFEEFERPLLGRPQRHPAAAAEPATAPAALAPRLPDPARPPAPEKRARPTASAPPATRTAPGGAGLILTCSCGRVLELAARFRGQRTICPTCFQELEVPREPDQARGER